MGTLLREPVFRAQVLESGGLIFWDHHTEILVDKNRNREGDLASADRHFGRVFPVHIRNRRLGVESHMINNGS